MSHFQLEPSWQVVLANELIEPYIHNLEAFLQQEHASGATVFPPQELIFNALLQTPFDRVRVVIVGQDPYHGQGQAHGLSFSVPKGIPLPPSLKNIFRELSVDLGMAKPAHGCLLRWAQQGVLLLNATLTVRQGMPMSHHGKGWERFTDAIIAKLSERSNPLIFVLWGRSAQEKCQHLKMQKNSRHYFLTAPHPSPFSAHQGFLGCRHFSRINDKLREWGEKAIDWSID